MSFVIKKSLLIKKYIIKDNIFSFSVQGIQKLQKHILPKDKLPLFFISNKNFLVKIRNWKKGFTSGEHLEVPKFLPENSFNFK